MLLLVCQKEAFLGNAWLLALHSGSCLQVQQQVSSDIDALDTELVSPNSVFSGPQVFQPIWHRMMRCFSVHLVSEGLLTCRAPLQCFNIALTAPLTEEQAATLTWCVLFSI
jgi:hypothetical protein